MINNGDELLFTSGHRILANCGIVGLSPELDVYQGYDGAIDWAPDSWSDLTVADMLELADHMIERWTKFRDSIKKPSP